MAIKSYKSVGKDQTSYRGSRDRILRVSPKKYCKIFITIEEIMDQVINHWENTLTISYDKENLIIFKDMPYEDFITSSCLYIHIYKDGFLFFMRVFGELSTDNQFIVSIKTDPELVMSWQMPKCIFKEYKRHEKSFY